MKTSHEPKSAGRLAPQWEGASGESGNWPMIGALSLLEVAAAWRACACAVFCFLSSLAAPAVALGAGNEPPAGFVSLFNGRDLAGWTVPTGDNGHWKVVDGVIDYDAQSEAKDDKSLWTQREFGNFVL